MDCRSGKSSRACVAPLSVIDALESRLLLANFAISEFMASNAGTLADQDGAYSDWIEVRNLTGSSQSLNGWHLTDSPANLGKWTFPDVSLAGNAYLLIFASGKNRAIAGQQLHTNFRLEGGGGYVALTEPNGQTIASSFDYPQQETDISYGVDYNAAGNPLRFFATPTPGQPNQRSEVVINEIHYDPDIKTELVEFLEIYNPGTLAVNLTGARITQGLSVHLSDGSSQPFQFPSGTTLAAGGYLLIAPHPDQVLTKFGKTALGPPTGTTMGSLSNEGEDIVIRNAAGGQLDEVDYGAGFPWPTVGDAPGRSIELMNPDLDNNLGGNWRSYGGTAPVETTLIAANSVWSYRKGTSDYSPLGLWRTGPLPQDGTWFSGPGRIGYDSTDIIATKLTDMQYKAGVQPGYASIFLRSTFTVSDPSQFAKLRLEASYSDGINVWINGVRSAGTICGVGEPDLLEPVQRLAQ